MIKRTFTLNKWRAMSRCAVLGVLLLCGCGSGGRQSIDGTVTLDGQPLEKGSITFIPQAGTQGPTAGAEIVDGNYTISTAGGTFAGKFRVEITAAIVSGKIEIEGKIYDKHEQFLPDRYNTASQLEAEGRFEFGGVSWAEYVLTVHTHPDNDTSTFGLSLCRTISISSLAGSCAARWWMSQAVEYQASVSC